MPYNNYPIITVMIKHIFKVLPIVALVFTAFAFVACSSDDDNDVPPQKETLKSLEAGFRASLSSNLFAYFNVEATITNKTTGESRTEVIKSSTAETSRFTATTLPQSYTLQYLFTKKADAPATVSFKEIVVSCKGIYSYTGSKGSFITNRLYNASGLTYRLEGIEDVPIDDVLEVLNGGTFEYSLSEKDVLFE